MKYNFDEEINRFGTDSFKYDMLPEFFGSSDVLPLWVADTDFKTPPFILEAIRKRLEHGILGYTFRGDEFFQSVIGWTKRRYDWEVERAWISFSPGVVSAISASIQAFTKPDDKIVIQPPVYSPFFECVTSLERILVENPLKMVNGRYCFDLEDLESKIDGDTKMLILCNPHNPGGMAWSRDELKALSDLCLRHEILVVSDEIHADLTYKGQRHTPFASLSDEAAQNSIVCMSPSKTFNVAGLSTSVVVIPNLRKFKTYEKTLATLHIQLGNILGNVALETAFNEGDEWLSQAMDYVGENYRYLEKVLTDELPKVKIMKPEATFLVWLDFREYGMDAETLNRFFIEEARVALNNGKQFGSEGEGFMRINIGCTRTTLQEALKRICKAFKALG
ncbi:MAG: PatB family C-S lyase [Prolixibacteraceae bacterium]|nr:PatB family C-S lyase [Prolixibacteraceae bacterium]